MDSFRIKLSGRWRAAVDAGVGRGDVALRDHIELQLGERNLTAHLGDDEVLPFLIAVAEALGPGARVGTTTCLLSPSNHRLGVERRGGEVRVSLIAASGRVIVHEEVVDGPDMRDAVRRTGLDLLEALAALEPGWMRRAPVRRLRRAVDALAPGADAVAIASAHVATAPTTRTRGVRTRRSAPGARRFPLEVDGVGLRLGAQWAATEGSGGQRTLLLRLLDALLQLARLPERRPSIPWSSAPRTTLSFERRPDGTVAWALRDTLAPWMNGVVTLPTLVSTIARCGRTLRAVDVRDLGRRLREIRAWMRAAEQLPVFGDPNAPVGDDATEDALDLPALVTDEPAARRLFHVAFRRSWRKPLRRFVLPPQALGEASILVHLPDATVGLAFTTGRERWRRAATYPVLVGGPCGLVFDDRGRLVRLNPETGATLWARPRPWTDAPVTAVAADDEGIVLATEAGAIIGVDANGTPRFRSRMTAGTALGLTLSRDLVWIAGEDRRLHALRRSDGGLHARVPLAGHLVGAPTWRAGGLVVAADEGPRTRLTLHDRRTGEVRTTLVVPGVFQSLRALEDPHRVAVVTIVEESTTFTVADLQKGAIAYALPPLLGRATLTPYRGLLLCGAGGGRLVAHDAADGHPIWDVGGDDGLDTPSPPVSPLGVGGLIYALGAALVTLEPATGRIVSRYPLDDIDLGSWLVSRRGDVLLADTDRALLLLERSGHLARVD
ncbi:PQQ-like beta-propeller repeat protein [Myxococcota bacterium]|nr:PQQ-like beta-propeller repeat protein [Myxococcota bacterium]